MISIVVPIYKVKEEYIRSCMASIKAQTYKDYEILIIDDCTPDNGGRFCEELAANDPQIKVIHHSVNKGLAGARETGKNEAKGEYLFFLDPDDVIEKECLEKLYNAMTATKADIVICKYRRNLDPIPRTNTEHLASINDLFHMREDILLQNDTHYNIGSNWGKLYRLDFIRRHNIVFEESARKSQDRVFMFDFYGASPVAYMLDYVGYVYTVDNVDSICQKFNPDFLSLINNTSNALAKRVQLETRYDFKESLSGWYMMLIFDYMRLVACNSQNRKTKAEKIDDLKTVMMTSPYKDALWDAPLFKMRKKCALMIVLLRLGLYTLCYNIMNRIFN